MNKKRLIVIVGATAVGKTAFCIELAKALNTVIVSADSRQFFKEMSIGTAKPSEEELNAVKHYFINSHSIAQELSAGDFERECLDLLAVLYQNHDDIIVTGGSGLYIKALTDGLDDFPEVPQKVRATLNEQLENEGLGPLQELLKKHDPEYYAQVDIQNSQRVVRALEVCLATGLPFSTYLNKNVSKRPFETIIIGLERAREELYERINLRVDLMMESGLLDEVKSLYSYRNTYALQTVGYQELFDFIDKVHSLARAVELIKRNSRRYAKRQLTWFKKQTDLWYSPEDLKKVLSLLKK